MRLAANATAADWRPPPVLIALPASRTTTKVSTASTA